ncbi:RHOMBOID-like protein 3 isoform X2 [Lycium barbarum]|uniref:RHOMBOID-like protein 3 isoform X2 n=1 Tax=Lycium barbarum TaxID=112863 RepID=UPI00293F2E16|nr:RHOMBOID-like protein 3 isoform X2 [Lycium barbarum]
MGALEWNKVVHHHQGWRLITCIWLHSGVIHLLARSMSFIFVGKHVEQQYGFVRTGIIYLLSGVGGSILASLFIRGSISVGASGALFGFLGAKLSELITNWTSHTDKVGALFTMFLIVVINVAIGILPHVGNFAHIGGFMTGFLLGFVLLPPPQLESLNLPVAVHVYSKYKADQNLLRLLALILLVTGFTVGLVMVFRGVNAYDHCHWCHYLKCVPTSMWKCDGT